MSIRCLRLDHKESGTDGSCIELCLAASFHTRTGRMCDGEEGVEREIIAHMMSRVK